MQHLDNFVKLPVLIVFPGIVQGNITAWLSHYLKWNENVQGKKDVEYDYEKET